MKKRNIHSKDIFLYGISFFKKFTIFIYLLWLINLKLYANMMHTVKDTCPCCFRVDATKELKHVIAKYNNITKCNGSIYEVDYTPINDSINYYIITISNTTVSLLEKPPSKYTIIDSSLLFIYDKKKYDVVDSCLAFLFDLSTNYSNDKIEIVSWSNYTFKYTFKSFEFQDDIPIISFEVKNGVIISIQPTNNLLHKKYKIPIFIK
ncbi:MAG: hypothetical protein A2309_05565 [Bacteroidetes bacterium RIFOXYB2_FULL_35_7]|nr:MAG: hypothetical protein A2X01_00040 [Bacteroidetes bacterium GWF2_35_48]OFY94965.1 MAG: hypothetical protein A2309_05565 [Bacteroidetes bacterium RIFOXYB2_FULL_35_7]OFZ04216.1 MAG: hypothetical protein A2491_18140 [Bacteroidetes bacterium RIFOXYC12_FULL_35_7]HBX53054.1 hypothetical protein [Bacteroidales bacterium]